MTLTLNDPTLLCDRAYLAGAWVAAEDGATLAVTNPATGAVIGHVPDLGRTEAARALDAAAIAQKAWAAHSAKDRAQILRRWFDLMMANQADLAVILTAEMGKPLA